MEAKISQFIDDLKVPTKKFTIKQLREREETWRALWSWLSDDVKYFLLRIGSTVRILKRDYRGSIGELGEVKFAPSQFEVVVYEKKYDETDSKYYYEKKVQLIPQAAVMMLEFVTERELAETVESYEIQPLEEGALSVEQ